MKKLFQRKLFRTKNGFIFKGEAELGQTFKYPTDYASEVEDEVIAIGTELFDLVQPGDLVQFHWKDKKSKHPMWLTKVTSEEFLAFVANKRIAVDRIFIDSTIHGKPPIFLESNIRSVDELDGMLILGVY